MAAVLILLGRVESQSEGIDMIDIDDLRKQARLQKKILRITFYPDVDSVPNFDRLNDTDDLAEWEFVPVSVGNAKP